ncbi:E3 SUMO-protein ligase ZBED1-like [Vanacampus margaritifer]
MENSNSRKRSRVWQHFDVVSPTKVQCLICSQELVFGNNTSSMLRHLRAKHEQATTPQQSTSAEADGPSGSRKQKLDEALLNLIIIDAQPLSLVENEGFRAFVQLLDPTYVIPGRKALKQMLQNKYRVAKDNAVAEIEKTSTVSLTSDMWTSINMDAYLAVTCHFVNEEMQLSTLLLGIKRFPRTHTAANLAEAKETLMAEWGIRAKVMSLVTDSAANMIACANRLNVRHISCFAHMLNLVMKKSLAQTPGLDDLRTRARSIVGHFKSSTTAREKLSEIQRQMGRPEHKLLQEVETRWNSTFAMLQRLHEQREPLDAALSRLNTTIVPFSAEEYETISQCLSVLSPFNEATVEMSTESRVSGSKVIPMVKMLKHFTARQWTTVTIEVARNLVSKINSNLQDKFATLEKITTLTLATLLDPRFKEVGFCNTSSCQAAVERLTRECANQMPAPAQQLPPAEVTGHSQGNSLWGPLDSQVETQRASSSTANAIAEVQRYLKDKPLPWTEKPLQYWFLQKTTYPHLYPVALQYLSTPASSVPCERIFSKAGEIVSQRRSRLKPSTIEQILFLNKNL